MAVTCTCISLSLRIQSCVARRRFLSVRLGHGLWLSLSDLRCLSRAASRSLLWFCGGKEWLHLLWGGMLGLTQPKSQRVFDGILHHNKPLASMHSRCTQIKSEHAPPNQDSSYGLVPRLPGSKARSSHGPVIKAANAEIGQF